MKSAQLICPLCKDRVDRIVYRFHLDSERAIVEKIKSEHPGWTEADGICSRCLDYYHTEIVMQQRILPEIGPHFPVKSVDDFIILPTALRLDADPRFTGKGVTICFIDSGYYPHPDLNKTSNRIKAIIDITGTPTKPDSCRNEQMWHGTMTSVVCAGDGFLSNGLYKGIANQSDLVLIKAQDEEGNISTQNISKALEWVLIHHKKYNIRIINISVAGDEETSYTTSQMDLLAQQLVTEGIVIVAAVGNDVNGHIKPPANARHVITVGGIDDENHLNRDTRSMYHSTYGVTADGLMKPELIAQAIWIAAPILPNTKEYKESVALHSSLSSLDKGLNSALCADVLKKYAASAESNDLPFIREAIVKRIQSCKFISPHYMHVDGTSFAAPIVSAVIAQLLEVNPKLDPPTVREILFSTAERIKGLPVEPQGYGVIQPRKAILKALKKVNMFSQYDFPYIDRQKKTIAFYVQHDSASQITLAGTFNDWSREVLYMQPNFHGVWKIEIPILPEGKYHYKFLVDDLHWIEDVLNPYQEPDGFNGLNSVLHIQSN
jgi:serine protease AprX